MKAVVLAAGYGGRLRPLTVDTPKVILETGGRPLIHYSLDALYSAGISDIAVVVGHQAEKIRAALEDTYPFIEFIYNERHDGGNALSVHAASAFVSDEPFVVCMGDHPISPDIVQRLLSDERDGCVLCVDPDAWHPSQMDDATRVLVDPGSYILNIGKHLKVWNATDTGVFKMTPSVFPAIELLMSRLGTQVSITDVVRSLGDGGQPFATCDVGGMFWADVDTLEDYRSVDSLLRETHGERL